MSILPPTVPEKVIEVVRDYYRQAQSLPLLEELPVWCNGLPLSQQDELTVIGLEGATRLPAFRRYVLEKHGYSMQAYVAEHLTPAEQVYWVDDGDSYAYVI